MRRSCEPMANVESDRAVNSVTSCEKPSQATVAVYLLYASVMLTTIRGSYQGLPTWVGHKFPKIVLMSAWYVFGVPFRVVYADLVVVGIVLCLCYVVDKGRIWARTIIVIFIVLELLSILSGISAEFSNRFPLRLSELVIRRSAEIPQMVLQVLAVMLLLERSSSEWFKNINSMQ